MATFIKSTNVFRKLNVFTIHLKMIDAYGPSFVMVCSYFIWNDFTHIDHAYFASISTIVYG